MPATFSNQIRIIPKGFPETMASLAQLVPDLKVAVRDTIKKTLPFIETTSVEMILDRYNISKASLMDQSSRHGRWQFKRKEPSESDLRGGLQVVGTRMPVMRFSVVPDTVPEQKGVPVSWRTRVSVQTVKRSRGQIGKPNVFLAQMKTGHIGVYKRKIPNPGGPRRYRPDGQPTQLPITEEYMLSVPEMLSGKKLRAKLDAKIDKFVRAELLNQMKKVSGKAWARAKAGIKAILEEL